MNLKNYLQCDQDYVIKKYAQSEYQETEKAGADQWFFCPGGLLVLSNFSAISEL